MKLIDPHLHFDVLLDRVPGTETWFRDQKAGAVSWSYAYQGVEATSDLTAYFAGQQQLFAEVAQRLPLRYLVGIHPRNLPVDLKPEQVGALLEPWISDPNCAGLGEVGIDTDDPREEDIFAAQLAWSKNLRDDQVVGVHTPRANKPTVTRQILKVIEANAPNPERVLVDHCTADTLADVLAVVGFAGISLSPNKCTVDEGVALLLQHQDQANRLMCNTDSAIELYEPLLAVAEDERLSDGLRRQVLHDTAAGFFEF